MTATSFTTQAFVDGEYRDAVSGERFVTENPSTGQMLAQVAAGDAADVDVAVTAAREAFEDGRWSRRPPAERKKVLLALADRMESNLEELAELDAREAGKPISDCRGTDLPEAIGTFRWYAEAVDKLYDAIAPTGPDQLGLVVSEPVGVVGAVLPWNFPIMLAAWKAAPALAAGNSVILKPAELSSLSTLRLGALAAEAGVPDGVLNVIPGFGESAGQALGRHMGVDVVSFTGSTEVGRLFLQYSAQSNLKRVVLECGGKSPQVVFRSAPDLDLVAGELAIAGYANMGENCTCGSRVLVDRSVHDALMERMISATNTWTVGDAMDPGTRIGPLIERAHLEKVRGYVDQGRKEGARIVTGGTTTHEGSGGHFFTPTIFDDVSNSMKIAREEIFGPVISVIPFSDEDEAIRIANDTNYGLAASIWTTDISLAIRASRAIRAGTVAVNAYSEGDITTPFGGFKESGFGGRDKGVAAFSQYAEMKTIWVQLR
jgi:gamma-glutamyl-gamma-aminobutyraldehyde dehydrogenase